MTRYVDFLLIGGGLASATAAEALRAEGADGTIVMLSAENELPYHRPPLSTRFLYGNLARESLGILKSSFYQDNHIEVMLGTRATSIDTSTQIVQTDVAGQIHYEKLLIATGTRPIRLNIPGSELPGLYYVRTINDAQAIKTAAANAKHVVVIGGSFIGMEIASSLTQQGLQVTLIAMREMLFEKLDSPPLSAFFQQLYVEKGVTVLLDEMPVAFQGKGRIEAVVTQRGKVIPCDFVVAGIGVTPDTDFLNDSGIAIENGVVVNSYLQTSEKNIYAAGDVAHFFDRVFNVRRRIEHWDNAIKQGKLAAKNMLGQQLPYDEVSYFFCDLFNISFQFFGRVKDTPQRIELGTLKDNSYALLYLKDDIPRAVFSMGRPARETKAIEALIRYRVCLHGIKERLNDPNFSLDRIPNQTILILQGGGALGAFECGVVKAFEENKVYPDIVAGVSIGAFNGAIIAGNPRSAAAALDAFWDELAIFALDLPDEGLRQMISSWQSLVFGAPSFFRPRWFSPTLNPADSPLFWTSIYDPSPVKELLRKYVDFERLKSSPVRLLLSAVNVETAMLEVFDSYVEDITPDHILASGSLPPGFPWTTINGKHYWDGGIVSNSPLEQVIERCGATGKRAFIVDLFPNKQTLPTNLMEVIIRRDEILYAERIRNDSHTHAVVRDFRKLVEDILNYVDPATAHQLTQRPRYIQLMGDVAEMEVTRITREDTANESPSRDYDFSRTSIERYKQAGYKMAKQALS